MASLEQYKIPFFFFFSLNKHIRMKSFVVSLSDHTVFKQKDKNCDLQETRTVTY